LGACQTPLLSLAPGATLKSWGLPGLEGNAQPRDPWGAGALRPVDLDRALVGSSADPSHRRVEDRRGNSAVANEALVRESLQHLRPQVAGAAEPNTVGAAEAGACALE
jgi:hypothetical protein